MTIFLPGATSGRVGVYGGPGVSRWNVTSGPDVTYVSQYWLTGRSGSFQGRSAGRDVTRPGPAIGLADPGLAALFPFQGRLAQPRGYLTVTVAPAPSRAAFALSALSLLTFSSTVLGAPSTRSLASLRPRLVRLRTSLMTWIFLSPAASRMTSNSSCSSASSAAAAPP